MVKKNDELKDIPESQQKYLDTINLISKQKRGGWVTNKEIAESLNVKPSSVTNMLYQLKNASFLDWSPRKGIRLTKAGKNIAVRLEEIHVLLKELFLKILKIQNKKLVNKLSCEIEHHIFNQTEDVYLNLKEFIHNNLEDL